MDTNNKTRGIDFQACFEANKNNSKGSRAKRFCTSPRKIVFSQLLKIISKTMGDGFKLKAKTFFNQDMLIVIPESVSESIYRYGFYEEGLTQMMISHLKEDSTFLDIGAHYGYFTLLAANIVGSKGGVHSFEPTPSTFDILKQNVANFKNITINNKAVYSCETDITINDYGTQHSSFNSMYKERLSEDFTNNISPKEIIIKAVTIDDYIKSNGIKPDFVKIDAESAEYNIIQGMSETIDKYKPIISVEVGDKGVKDVPLCKDLIKLVTDKGYSAYDYRGGNILKHILKENEPYEYDNILFLPNK